MAAMKNSVTIISIYISLLLDIGGKLFASDTITKPQSIAKNSPSNINSLDYLDRH
jgi:hypothetical protein